MAPTLATLFVPESSSGINPRLRPALGYSIPWCLFVLRTYLTAFRTIQGPREHGWTFLTFRVRPCPPASNAPGYLKHPNANRSGAIHPSGTLTSTTPSNPNHCKDQPCKHQINTLTLMREQRRAEAAAVMDLWW
ncbi:hypothetical protein JMJ77_0001961 [Colletotrichum scovillei]|uniref:Uncharacterized protein n=1 Tax=Colletotrichum scovillei TaxID=1209932 RepID=A0A9P7R8N1_9PEZI|nr:hypothetical protein JMJ77_0001961 [Colletotrichum scovillei]KAG7070374.1 hypothetical protein JMJ76_0001627 [Colletotrichum scovillei]KAG7078648.1 hypothetical protein JMJ78_0002317 [Colletotrichum scovillei]